MRTPNPLIDSIQRRIEKASPKRAALLLLFTCVGVTSTLAQNWSYFVPVGNSLSVSFAQVDSTTYAWKFRNDGYNRIKYLEFTYSYINADTGQYRTDQDVLRGSLGRGETFGGWAAFTANSRFQPVIHVTKVDRE